MEGSSITWWRMGNTSIDTSSKCRHDNPSSSTSSGIPTDEIDEIDETIRAMDEPTN